MNGSIFSRIFWKEYRAQRSFWISMAVLTLVVESLLRVGRWDSDVHRTEALFMTGLGLAAFYALASAATLFAMEREAETFEFLRALPVKPLVVAAGKTAFSQASTAALFLVAWTLAIILNQGLPNPLFQRTAWAVWGLAGIEFWAWGIFFSLLLKRPLLAVILAATSWTCIAVIISRFTTIDPNFFNIVPGRLMIVAIVTVADVGLATRWFRAKRHLRAGSRSPRRSEATGWSLDRAPSAPGMLGRLLWQEFRQSAAMTAGLIVTLLPVTFLFYVMWLFVMLESMGWYAFQFFLPLFLLAGFLSGPLLGSSVFLSDQMGCRFRFLAEHGVPARLVWLSRQIHGLLVMLLGLLLILPPLIGVIAENHLPNGMLVIECLLGFAVTAYACGQLCSMGIRSGILAATFGTSLTCLLSGWAILTYWLGLSWLWTVGPLLLAFMAATWLHAPNWLMERKSWRGRLRVALVVAVPALAILATIPLVRVYEIPLVGPGFDVNELTRPATADEQETLTLCARADKLLSQPAADAPARRKATEQAVELALEIARRPPLEGSRSDQEGLQDRLAVLVLGSGKQLQSEGKLDSALDRYVAAERIAGRTQSSYSTSELEIRLCERLTQWAAQSGQTSQRLLDALRTLEKLWRTPLSYSNEIKREYLWERRTLEQRDAESLRSGTRDWYDPYIYMSWLPWERARALRLLNYLTDEEYTRYRAAEEVLAAGGFLTCPPYESLSPRLSGDIAYKIVRLIVTPYARLVVLGPTGRIEPIGHGGFLFACLKVECHRRATLLVLALEAWKLDHGGLPESLEDLKGKYLDQLPVDPYNGEPFRYKPKGLARYVTWRSPDFGGRKILEPHRPFVACGSWETYGYDEFFNSESTRQESPRESTANFAPLTAPLTEWDGVWVFPIP